MEKKLHNLSLPVVVTEEKALGTDGKKTPTWGNPHNIHYVSLLQSVSVVYATVANCFVYFCLLSNCDKKNGELTAYCSVTSMDRNLPHLKKKATSRETILSLMEYVTHRIFASSHQTSFRSFLRGFQTKIEIEFMYWIYIKY